MSQVIIEFAKVVQSPPFDGIGVSHYVATTEEITSSASSQATTATASGLPGETVVTVINNGTDAIWVNFNAAAAASSPSRFIPPNGTRDFSGVPSGYTVSVINDS